MQSGRHVQMLEEPPQPPSRRLGAPLPLAGRSWTDSQSVPSISGRVEVILTVRDPVASMTWYSELLGLEELYDFTGEDGLLHYIALIEPKSQVVLCLVGHQEHSGELFSEFRTASTTSSSWSECKVDLEEWVEKLNGLQIPNSGVKQPEHTRNAMWA